MKFNFSQPITAYELLAIVLAIISLLVPIVKWIYNKWIKQLKFNFFPSGTISLYQNKSGSYLSFGGVYEAKNKSAIVKEINANVIRETDNATLMLTWSTFSSPVYRQVAGNYESSFETAHPFKVDIDSLEPVFIEFASLRENINEKIEMILKPVYEASETILSTPNIILRQADDLVRNSNEAKKALISLNDDFFWKPGTYQLKMITKYNDSQMCKSYEFILSSDESEKLRKNIENLLVIPVANRFRMNLIFNSVKKTFTEKI